MQSCDTSATYSYVLNTPVAIISGQSGSKAWEVTLLHTEAEGGCLGLNLSIPEVPERFLLRSNVKQQMHWVQACRSSAFTQ